MSSLKITRTKGNYNGLTANYINMKKDIESISKSQEEMKNTLEGINSRLDEAGTKVKRQK